MRVAAFTIHRIRMFWSVAAIEMSNVRKAVPWWLRIGAKIVLARLPIPYRFWKSLQFFEHGDMNQPQRALDTFLEHAGTAGVLDMRSHVPRLIGNGDDFSVLEIGPGDSLFTTVVARSLGASRSWLVDAGAYATTDMATYVALFNLLRYKGYVLPFDTDPLLLADVLHACNGQYLTEGVKSFTQVPSASVDFCFSNAVLEHIPKGDFARLAAELLRVLKPDGVCVHRVDLKDHLGGGLNNLRFSEARWEGALFRKSGFYPNRIRFGEMVTLFEASGFECRLPRIVRWERLPLSRAVLDESFHQLADDDLLVSGFDVVLRRKDEDQQCML
jgi:SAM-dependent methyltransferase